MTTYSVPTQHRMPWDTDGTTVWSYTPKASFLTSVAASDYASAPDSASFNSVAGNFEASVDVYRYHVGVAGHICGKWTATGNQRSWALNTDASDHLVLYTSADGSTVTGHTSSIVVPNWYTSRLCVKFEFYGNNGAGGHTVRFFTAPYRGAAYTQLGTDVVTAGTTSIFDSTAPLQICSVDDTRQAQHMEFYSFEMRNSVGGTVVASPFFYGQTPNAATFVDAQSNTWTMSGAFLELGATSGTLAQITSPATLSALNSENTTATSTYSASGSSWIFMFPEQRSLAGFVVGAGGGSAALGAIQYSNDTTTGLDGTWYDAGVSLFTQDPSADRTVFRSMLGAIPAMNSNSTFDGSQGSTGWYANSVLAVGADATVVHYGSGSMQIISSAVANNSADCNAFGYVVPGNQYAAIGWLRCETADSIVLGINWYNSSLTNLSTSTQVVTVAANTWTQFAWAYTAPANSVYANLKVGWNGATVAGHILYADGVSFSPYVPWTSTPIPTAKAVKVVLNTASTSNLYYIHLYGDVVSGNADRCQIWNNAGTARLSLASTDFGDIALSTSHDVAFRVKNLSTTKTANTITVSVSANTDTTPSFVKSVYLSTDGVNFSSSLSIGSLAPGDLSASLYLRLVTNASTTVGPWSIKLQAIPVSMT